MGGRPGPVRDRAALYQRQWQQLLSETTRQAHTAHELPPGTDPDQLAFELGALLAGSDIAAVLHDDNTLIDRARQAVHAQLGSQDGATTGLNGHPVRSSLPHWPAQCLPLLLTQCDRCPIPAPRTLPPCVPATSTRIDAPHVRPGRHKRQFSM